MINFSPNTVIVGKVNASGNFQEDSLDCGDINAVSTSGDQTISGNKTFTNLYVTTDPTTSGQVATKYYVDNNSGGSSTAYIINDLTNLSGITTDSLNNLNLLTLDSGTDSAFAFSYPILVQPINDVSLKTMYIPRGSTSSGNYRTVYNYNIYKPEDDLTPTSYTYSGVASGNLTTSDYGKFKVLTYTIPSSQFTASSAPFILSVKATRDTTVVNNYPNNISLLNIYIATS